MDWLTAGIELAREFGPCDPPAPSVEIEYTTPSGTQHDYYNIEWPVPPQSHTFGNYVRQMFLNIFQNSSVRPGTHTGPIITGIKP